MFRLGITAWPFLLFLIGCGPSAEERGRIADRACSEIMETRKFESSKRASIWNNAVDAIGLKGSYWGDLSDTNLQLSIGVFGSHATREDCKTSLLLGNHITVTD